MGAGTCASWGCTVGQSYLEKLLPRGHGPSDESAFPHSGVVIPWKGGMVGKPKHGTAKGHRIKSSGLLESPWQGREVKHGPESSVTQAGRQRRQV